MKKLLFATFCFICCQHLFGQYKIYCEIAPNDTFMGLKGTVRANYGQAIKFTQGQNTLVDDNGSPIVFNSIVDAVNYLSYLGWNFEASYVDDGIRKYFMSKIINNDEDLNIKTSDDYKQEQIIQRDNERKYKVPRNKKKQ